MKTASEILFEYGIDIMKMNDDFNCQLLFAMERYAEQKEREAAEKAWDACENNKDHELSNYQYYPDKAHYLSVNYHKK